MKKTISVIIVLGMILCLGGCNISARNADDLTKNIEPSNVVGKPQDAEFIHASLDFAVELFKRSSNENENENTLISPLSVQLALAMTLNGAKGKTKTEMETVLGGIPAEELNEYLYTYVKSLPTDDKYKMHIANSVWVRENALVADEGFLSTNKSYYDAQIYSAPFDKSTADDVNGWVDENTDGMIKKIIDEISSDTVMYLINALAFDAEWSTVYNKENIYTGTFTSAAGDAQSVSMMTSVEGQYISTDGAEGFIKYYKDDKYAFAALLPAEGTDINEFIAELSADEIRDALETPETVSVYTTIPKFSYEYSLSMNGVLSEMGMPTAFLGKAADFTGMGDCPMGNVYIGDVLHKTYISVDELGTKAGAVTKVEMVAEGVPCYDHNICLDRPFVYMIIDTSANLPVFIGSVMEICE